MVTAKDLIANSKTDLRWEVKDADYTSWRNNVKDYCASKLILGKTKAGEKKWNQCLVDIPRLNGFKPAIWHQLATSSEFHSKALKALVVDILKKRSETVRNLALKRAGKRRFVLDTDTDMDDDAHEGNAIAVWIADPEEHNHKNELGEWTWNNRLRRKLAMIKDRSLEGIYTAVKAFLPTDKYIHEIQGSLLDPAPPTDDVPADWSRLNSDD